MQGKVGIRNDKKKKEAEWNVLPKEKEKSEYGKNEKMEYKKRENCLKTVNKEIDTEKTNDQDGKNKDEGDVTG